MTVSLIVAKSKNNILGKENRLLWHLPKDFSYFKEKTLHHPIILGRKTFESLPGLLPGRLHIIVTGDKNYVRDGAVVVHSLEDAINVGVQQSDEVFICGGGQIYKEALDKNLVDTMYITEIDTELSGDTVFPMFNKNAFELTTQECHPQDERHAYAFCFLEYKKKQV